MVVMELVERRVEFGGGREGEEGVMVTHVLVRLRVCSGVEMCRGFRGGGWDGVVVRGIVGGSVGRKSYGLGEQGSGKSYRY